MRALQRIRQKIIERDYYLSVHAEEEMLDDFLERADIEHAILNGKIEKKLTEEFGGQDIGLKALQEMAGLSTSCIDFECLVILL